LPTWRRLNTYTIFIIGPGFSTGARYVATGGLLSLLLPGSGGCREMTLDEGRM
jgi:hypothetical protein